MSLLRFGRKKSTVQPAAVPDRRQGPPFAFVPVEYASLHPVDLNFNGQWQLTGLRFAEERNRLTLSMRWRCLRTVFQMVRCFTHVTDAEGLPLGSMDHDIMNGWPRAVGWRPGDVGFEFYSLWLPEPKPATPAYFLRFGLWDPETGLRVPLTASSLPVTDLFTAATVQAGQAPGSESVFCLQPAAAAPCRARFGDSVELVGCSVTLRERVLWLRLRWVVSEVPRSELMFFGHAVTAADPDRDAVASFDQDMAVHGRGSWPRFEQDIVRSIPADAPLPTFIRAGVCTFPELARLEIQESSLPSDPTSRCLFIPVEPAKLGP